MQQAPQSLGAHDADVADSSVDDDRGGRGGGGGLWRAFVRDLTFGPICRSSASSTSMSAAPRADWRGSHENPRYEVSEI